MRCLRPALLGAVLLAVGAWLVTIWMRASGGIPGYDVYQYWLPNMLYALQRIERGGGGLLWNPFQNCGQPSFGISSTGLLYPLNALFLLLAAQHTMYVQLVCNLAIAGAGMYWLARELGAAPSAALCAALAFELGPATVDLNMWTLQVGDAYVWWPMILLFCERNLRRPSLGNIAGLGGSIALALLSGSPQLGMWVYQLVALRVAFEYLTHRPMPAWSSLAAVGAGLLLGPLLDAVQLIPGMQNAAASVRGTTLSLSEMRVELSVSLPNLRYQILRRTDAYNPIILIPFALASASWLRTSTRRVAIFYGLAGVLALALSSGPATPLYLWYVKLPFGSLFRAPDRFVWITNFCLAVLAGLGADALLRSGDTADRRRTYAGMMCVGLAIGCVYQAMRPLRPLEWGAIVMLLVAAALARRAGGARAVAAGLVITATAANVLTYGATGLPAWLNWMSTREMSIRRLFPNAAIYSTYADLFTDLRGRMTAQDRMFILHANLNYALAPKVASLFDLPSIDDYEPQPSRQWVEYLVMLRTGQPLKSIDQYYYPRMERFLPGARRSLLDLAAVRYLIVDKSVDAHLDSLNPALTPVTESSDRKVAVYENPQALPRAFYVPRVEVVADPTTLLRRLAMGRDDPRQVALIEAPPPTGFSGSDQAAGGSAEFVVDEPERVVVRVGAPNPGFLNLSDAYAPGWEATVNGASAVVLRANHTFRAVQVPAGESLVEFRYRPKSVWIGAAISGSTFAVLAAAAIRSWRRTRRAAVLDQDDDRRRVAS